MLRSRSRLFSPAACLAAGLLMLSPATPAAEDGKPAALELRRIMRELGGNLEAITAAISREDWDRVAALAPRVADHPEPPAEEKVRILTYLGADAAKFRQFDRNSHDAAKAMGQAAAARNGQEVIQSFARVQENCLGCHQGFRKRFLEHFYGLR